MCEFNKLCEIKKKIDIGSEVFKKENAIICVIHKLQLARELIADIEESLVADVKDGLANKKVKE